MDTDDSRLVTDDFAEWIHDTEEDDAYVSGIKVLMSCVCSGCGYRANREKPVCPHCRRKMIKQK